MEETFGLQELVEKLVNEVAVDAVVKKATLTRDIFTALIEKDNKDRVITPTERIGLLYDAYRTAYLSDMVLSHEQIISAASKAIERGSDSDNSSNTFGPEFFGEEYVTELARITDLVNQERKEMEVESFKLFEKYRAM